MNKKFQYCRFCLLALCLALSCSKIEEEQLRTRSLEIGFYAPFVWKDGDQAGVYSDASSLQNQRVQLPSASERIKVDVPAGAGSLYSLYPYSGSSGKDPSSLLVVIPQSQYQSAPGSSEGLTLPLSAASPISGDCVDLHFRPLAALIALNIYNPLSDGSEAVSSVSVSSLRNTGLCGVSTVDITAPDAAITSASSSLPLNLEIGSPAPLPKARPSSPGTYPGQLYLVISRQNYQKITFKVRTTAGKTYSIQTDDTSIDCVSNDVSVLNINLATHQICKVTEKGTEPFYVETDITDAAFEGVDREEAADDGYREIESPLELDFSRVGYHWGDEPIPVYPQYGDILLPGGGDDLPAIQAAIDAFPEGAKGAIVLGPGVFHTGATVNLNKSGLVIRGTTGSDGALLTTILHTSSEKQDIIQVGGSTYDSFLDWSCNAYITPEHTPVGAMYVITDNSSAFHPGDRVAICRCPNSKWIEDLKMTREYGLKFGWLPDAFNTVWRRYVIAVEGDKVYLDNPVVMSLDRQYGGGFLVRNVLSGMKSESGVEDLVLDCKYDKSVIENDYYSFYSPVESDENHAHSAVKMVAAEHCWARNVVSRHVFFAAVQFGTYSQHCEARSCSYESPVSLITGSRRYGYSMGGGELHLVVDCKADRARHSFVTTGDNAGPNVFTRCSDTNSYSASGPHNKWSTGTLYDCLDLKSFQSGIVSPSPGCYVNSSNDRQLSQICVQDAYTYGSTDDQGWTGANLVMWNCNADILVCQDPWVTGKNWAWGCIGMFKHTSRSEEKYKAMLPDYRLQGNVNSSGTHIVVDGYESLYEYQLSERHAGGLVKFIPGFAYNN